MAKGKPWVKTALLKKELKKVRFWIIGAGKFGQLAAKRILASSKYPDARLTIVDNTIDALALVSDKVKIVQNNGVDFLIKNLEAISTVDWIIPAIPVHLACKWVMAALAPDYDLTPLLVPKKAADLTPNPIFGPKDELYASYADFKCPDNCPEPDGHCFFTGLPRDKDLHDVFASLVVDDFTPVVVKSLQLAPGVGGFKPKALFEAKNKVLAAHGPVLFCTACRCHGVCHAFLCKNKPKNSAF